MTIDPKKLKALHDKLKETEINESHITQHALSASQTLCMAPPHRPVNLNALIGISAFAQAMYELCDFGKEEGLLIDAEIDKAAARIVLGWKARNEPDPEGGAVLVFGPRPPKTVH